MKFCKNFILFVAVISITAVGCKKNNGSGALLTGNTAVVTTIAGDGTDGYRNGPALTAKFQSPVDVAIAPDGTIYIADYNSHRIRKIAGDIVSTHAGNDTFGILNGNGELARFKNPYRITTDGAGNVYVLDQVDTRVRKITPAGYVTTYAGTDQPGFLNGASLIAQFEINAEGIAADAVGNVYIGDTFNDRIRKITTAAQVSTLAGTGTEGSTNGDPGTAQFRYPDGMTVDAQGNLYVVDAGNLSIRKITPAGIVSTFAGSGTRGTKDGTSGEAQFDLIGDIVSDHMGDLFLTDNNRIRKITAQGVVSTIAGSTAGYVDGNGDVAKFKDPMGLGIDAQGNVYVADANNNRIRKISFQ